MFILSINKPFTVTAVISFCLLILLSILHTSKKCDAAISSPSFSGTVHCGAHLLAANSYIFFQGNGKLAIEGNDIKVHVMARSAKAWK